MPGRSLICALASKSVYYQNFCRRDGREVERRNGVALLIVQQASERASDYISTPSLGETPLFWALFTMACRRYTERLAQNIGHRKRVRFFFFFGRLLLFFVEWRKKILRRKTIVLLGCWKDGKAEQTEVTCGQAIEAKGFAACVRVFT